MPGTPTPRSRHYQQAIQYCERQDNRYGAGQSRYNAAITLADAGRNRDALLYAQAALRDFQAVGPGAAADAERARQLITQLEQEPAQASPVPADSHRSPAAVDVR